MIDILLFAGLKDRVGKDKLTWDRLPIRVKDLRHELAEIKGLERMDQVMIAVNETYVKEDTEIKPGDVVALIPPVSGG
ncbi:MAG TPA: MoaD/ThiS family protein [Sporolactobacillaceae bacterium]|nr:MoaD/ThiS family protein [Sporolactobacillaceae bacterium]